MSIINQTLRELDARRAAGGGLPPPTPVAARARDRRPVIAAGVLVALAATLGWFATGARDEAPSLAETRPTAPQPAPLPPAPVAPVAPVAAVASAAVGADPPVPPSPVAASPAPSMVARESERPREGLRQTLPRAALSRAADETAPEAARETPIRKHFSPPSGDAEAESRYRRAESLAQSGREDEARALLREAVRIAPGHVAARQLLATLLHEAGHDAEAEAVLAAGLRVSPERAWFALSLARMQAARGDDAAAAATLLDGIGARSVDAEYRATLAALLLRLDRHGDAARQYEQALAMAPGRGRWWMGLGLAHEGEGKNAAAQSAYARALAAGDLPEKLVEFVQSKLETP